MRIKHGHRHRGVLEKQLHVAGVARCRTGHGGGGGGPDDRRTQLGIASLLPRENGFIIWTGLSRDNGLPFKDLTKG